MLFTNQFNSYTPVIPPEQKDIKILMITGEDFNDLEVYYPYYRFIEEGYKVIICSPDGGDIKGKNGIILSNTIPAANVYPHQSDVLYLPGGKAPEKLKKEEKILKIIKEFASTKKLICSICHGTLLLAVTDLIKGKKITGAKDISQEIEKAGAHFIDNAVVIDDNLISSRAPGDLPLQLRAIISHTKNVFESGKSLASI